MLDWLAKPSPARSIWLCRTPPALTISTVAPMASRLQAVPVSLKAMKLAPADWLRRKRTVGAVRLEIQKSRSPSRSQSTLSQPAPVVGKSKPLSAPTSAKLVLALEPPRLRKQKFRSPPLSEMPRRIMS
ncbi:MAG: hypothetical protein R3F11_29265 [Verrucomicrobiales bacterium]